MGTARPSPMVGREAELAALVGAVAEARAGEARCVLVTGEAGIGTTRLVDEAVATVEDALVLTGRAADMATARSRSASWPIRCATCSGSADPRS